MSSHELTIAVVGLVLGVIVIVIFETKFLRKSMRARRVRAAKRADLLPDEAHNALITTKAIAAALERGGVRSEEASGLLREAQLAYGRNNYRVVMDLTVRAKEKLTAVKARHAAVGDAAKLDALPTRGGEDEPTTKELLQTEFPTNLAQAKFTLDFASSAIENGRSAGRDVSQAEMLLGQARTKFDGQDYSGALVTARLAHRSAEVGSVGPVASAAPEVIPISLSCTACKAPVRPDDVFCRKCGTRIGERPCPSCGTSTTHGDAFCPKCGAALAE